MYLTKSSDISRVLVQTFIGLSFVGLLGQKFAVRWLLEYLRQRRGSKVTKVLVVCGASHVDAYPRVQREHVSWHSDIIGFLVPEIDASSTMIAGRWPVLGTPCRIESCVLRTNIVDEVVVVQPFDRSATENIVSCAMNGGCRYALWSSCRERKLELISHMI